MSSFLVGLFLVFFNFLYSQTTSTKTMINGEIEEISKEKDKLKAEYELIIQKEKNKIAEIEAQYNSLALENKLYVEMMNRKLQKLKEELEKLSTENKINDEKNKQLLAKIQFELSKLKLENDLEMEKIRINKIKIEEEKNKLDFEKEKIKHEIFLKQSEVDKLKIELDLREKKDELKKRVDKEIVYTDKVFESKTLRISDRRIPLNGVITVNTADYIVDRINYFNNISTAPIFIVIDRSPGGSVMAGYKILKAMEASKSPVYVVVKSYAASMAAVITTLAKRSFVYPNAIILHHQMSTMAWGNITQLKERLEIAKKWEKRLLEPVAKKIGMD